jgi:Arylsulfotransferase (ASST)
MVSISDRTLKGLFVCSSVFLGLILAFFYGFAVGWERTLLWPHAHIKVLMTHANNLVSLGKWAPGALYAPAPAGAARERFKVYRPELLEPGYRAVMGWDGQHHVVWLFDEYGQELHAWPLEYSNIDPEGEIDPSFPHGSPHGLEILEDGTILVNFEGGALLARLDACGQRIWSQKGAYHHVISRAGDGNFWTWRGGDHFRTPQQFLVKFNAMNGDIIEQYSLIDDFIKHSEDTAIVFAANNGYDFDASSADLFHPNDIEELTVSMSSSFPDFSPGDLLISLRNLHLVAVLDPVSRSIKWWRHGPWRYQHDPDFTATGEILVYNNNSNRGNSNILTVNPQSSSVRVHSSSRKVTFYTHWRGKHQLLPNGSLLIVVPGEGRVLEVASSGELVLEFNNVASTIANASVDNAIWLPRGYFEKVPSCVKH